MAKVILLLLIASSFSCDLKNPIYSIVLSSDVYQPMSSFITSFNPPIGKNTISYFFDLIKDTEKCYIRLEETLIAYQPKINIYSVRKSADEEPFAYYVVVRGTVVGDATDLHNDNMILWGKIPDYVYTAQRAIDSRIKQWEGKEFVFTGHSLGAFLAHSLGYLYDSFSVGFESFGTVMQAEALEKLAGDGRSYLDYHLNKTSGITGVPNNINYILQRAEYKHLVIFVAPISSCLHFINFVTFERFSFMQMLETPGWTVNYHSSNLILDTLIENKNNLDVVMKDGLTFHLRAMFENELMNKQFEYIHDCVTAYTKEKGTTEELKLRLLDEIDDVWIKKELIE